MPSERNVLARRGFRISLAALASLAALLVFATGAMAHKGVEHVYIVSQGEPPEGKLPSNVAYFKTIQAAVNATAANEYDWILVEPGVYDEEVKVTAAHAGIHIRGMNRNTVILDGQGKAAPGGSNGILVEKANEVWIENMTGRNYDRETPDGGNGNAFWWSGGDGSEKEGAHGWWGKYLTAYDTTLNGGYGIFAQNEKEGSWEHIYASGYNDSGIYIGACWECKAKVNDATIEDNAVGYSGSNSGGRLVIENSVFRNNSAGIVPNGENPGDGPPPSNGMCDAKKPSKKKPYHLFTSTNIARCEIFRKNLVTENNNLEAPANGSTEVAPWGIGVELPGVMATETTENTITNNINNGVLGFEYPNPYPPRECNAKEVKEAEEKHEGCTKTIYFQLSGDKIANNTFENNGTHGTNKYNSQITLQGGFFPYRKFTSDNNCVSGNTFVGGATTYPENIEGTWGCQNNTTPPPLNGVAALAYVEQLSEESVIFRHAKPGVAPPPQETMPNPCENVPTNPLCP
jgi:hypothetical protein